MHYSNRISRQALLFVWLLVSCSLAYSQSTYYLPGSGNLVKQLNFENSSLKTQSFDYGSGWAGAGFGLSGTQRGAPEVVNVKDNPQSVTGSGNQVLAFNSQSRDASWYTTHPSAVGTNVYGGPDGQSQDDFFMYGGGWTASQAPTVTMQVWLPASATYTSLRMTTKYNNSSGGLSNSWPGMWLYHDVLSFRGPGRSDIIVPIETLFGLDPAESAEGRWWTLGMSVTPVGDIQYYAAPEYLNQLGVEHHVGNNSQLAADAGQPVNFLASNNDAIIMSSNRNFAASDQTLFDKLVYTRNALSVSIEDGDFDFDGNVDGGDFLVWQRGLSPDPFSASDLSDWNSNYGSAAAFQGTSSIPEPGSLVLMVLGCLFFQRNRRFSSF